MKGKKIILLAGLVALCSCSPESIFTDGAKAETSVSQERSLTITASLEEPEGFGTRTALSGNQVTWSAGDQFGLYASSEKTISTLTPSDAQAMQVGETKTVMLVNPSNTGAFLGYSGTAVAKTQGPLTSLSKASTTTQAETNLTTLSDYVFQNLYTNTDYRFTLTKTTGGWTLSHAASGVGIGSSSNSFAWSSTLQELTLASLTSSFSSSSDVVNGHEAQFRIYYAVTSGSGNSQTTTNYYLNSQGSSGNPSYTTPESASGWGYTTWLLFEVGSLGMTPQAFTLSSEAGRTSGEFTGTELSTSGTQYAFYPYHADYNCNAQSFQFTLPQEQTYVANSFASGANPAFGPYADGKVNFKNLCGVLELQLVGQETITSIELSDKGGQALWGPATVDLTTLGTDACVATVTGTGKTLTLNCGSGVTLDPTQPTSFYLVVPVGAFQQGFTAQVYTLQGVATLETTQDQTIHRSKIRAMQPCGLGELEVPEFNIVNETAAYYLENSNSVFQANTSSFLDDTQFKALRSSAFNVYRCDQPNVKTLTFQKEGATTARVLMATDENYTELVLDKTVTLTDGQGSYMLRNFVPGKTYYYKVMAGEEVLLSSCLKATGKLRMIRIDDGWNIRDLGGWTGWNGNTVRYEEIYRGGSLGGKYNNVSYQISQDSREELQRIGLKAHLDLRSMEEDKANIQWVGSSYGAYSLGYTPIPDGDFKLLVTCWALISAQNSSAAVGDLAYIIQSIKAGRPVYFHCRTGADRTGVVGLLVDGLLGLGGYTAGNNGAQEALEYELTGLSMDEDGTTAYNNGTLSSPTYSNRQTYAVMNSGTSYLFFQQLWGLTGSNGITLNTLMEKCYYYLNRYFSDNAVTTAGAVYINQSDLDWFINYMLGITDRAGNLLPGKTKFTGPSWAQEYTGYTLQNAIDTATANEFKH